MKKKVRCLLLTNSVKNSLACVAGIDLQTNNWLRIVANENGDAIQYYNYLRKKNGKKVSIEERIKNKFPLPLIVEFDIIKEVPKNTQPENVIIDNEIRIIKKFDIDNLIEFEEYPYDLWGSSNAILYDENLNLNSLFLIGVSEIKLYYKDRSAFGLTPQRRGIFWYNSIKYDLPITDPKFGNMKEKILENKYLVISLGEKYKDGYCYKIIAGIF